MGFPQTPNTALIIIDIFLSFFHGNSTSQSQKLFKGFTKFQVGTKLILGSLIKTLGFY